MRRSFFACALVVAACGTTPKPVIPGPVVAPSPPLALPPPPEQAAPEPEPAAPASEPPEQGPTLPATPYLDAAAKTRFPERALVAKRGPLGLALDGNPFTASEPTALAQAVEGIVVEQRARSVRVVLADGGLRLVAFAPRAALQAVSTRAAWLATAPDRAPDPTAGVRVAPGLALDPKERRGASVRVTGEADEVAFDGWIAEDAVGVVYVPKPFTPVAGTRLVLEGAVVSTPRGDAIARFSRAPDDTPPGFVHDVTPLAGAAPGFQGIHVQRASIEVRGVVPVAAFRKGSNGIHGSGVGFFSVGGVSDSLRVILRKGGGVHSEAGDRVGVALARTDARVSFTALDGKSSLVGATLLFGRFGFVSAWVRASDLEPAKP